MNTPKNDTRAVSTTLGFLILIGVTFVSITVLLGSGTILVDNTRDAVGSESREHAMTELDSQFNLVAFDGTTNQQVDLAAGGNENVRIVSNSSIHIEIQTSDYSEIPASKIRGCPSIAQRIKDQQDLDLHNQEVIACNILEDLSFNPTSNIDIDITEGGTILGRVDTNGDVNIDGGFILGGVTTDSDDIVLTDGAEVGGDIVAPPGTNIDIDGGSTVGGDIVAYGGSVSLDGMVVEGDVYADSDDVSCSNSYLGSGGESCSNYNTKDTDDYSGMGTPPDVNPDGTVNTVVADRNLSSLVYQSSESDIAYEAGGVWKQSGDNPNKTSMVSPPEFSSKQRDTMTLPIINPVSNGDFTPENGKFDLRKSGSTGLFPVYSQNSSLTNPLEKDKEIVMTIQSRFYVAWGEYFSSKLDAEPFYNHTQDSVTVVIQPNTERTGIKRGITSFAPGQKLDLRGQGGNVIVDSYNSNTGKYPSSKSRNGSIGVVGAVELQQGTVEGNVVAESNIALGGGKPNSGNGNNGGNSGSNPNSFIDGDATTGGQVIAKGSTGVGGNITEHSKKTIDKPQRTDEFIGDVSEAVSDDNDNNDSSKIDGGTITNANELKSTNPTTRIKDGTYKLSSLSVSNQNLEFDISNGNIVIVVDGDVSFQSAEVSVYGGEGNQNRVEIYTRSKKMNFDATNVTVYNQKMGAETTDASRMWFYGTSGTFADMHNSQVVGTIYAPGTSSSPGTVRIETQSNLYGAVVGGQTEVRSQSAVHYDEALADEPILVANSIDRKSIALQYFHISIVNVAVDTDS